MARLASALFVAVLIAAVACTQASVQQNRRLKAIEGTFAPQPTWPYCRCDDYRNISNAYTLTLTSSNVTNDALAVGEFCFTITYNGPQSNPTACYTALENSLDKIQFAIQPACPPSFDVSHRYISINGRQKTSSWEIKNYPLGSILKLYHLGLNKDTANGSVVCLRASYPCNVPENFFDSVPATYTVSESSGHKCCPITSF